MACPGSKCPALDGASAQYGFSGAPNNPLKITITLNTACDVCQTIPPNINCIQFNGQGAVSIGNCTQSGLTVTVSCKPPPLTPGQNYAVSVGHILRAGGGQHEGTLSTPYTAPAQGA